MECKIFTTTLISLINIELQINVGSGKNIKTYLTNEGSGTNGGPGIFVTVQRVSCAIHNAIGTSYPKIATNFQSLYLAEIFALCLLL